MPWKAVKTEEVDPKEIGVIGNGIIHLVHVKINDANKLASILIQEIGDTSWVYNLDIFSQAAYETTVQKTADKLVNLFRQVTNSISSEFGEYVVSLSASQVLGIQYRHNRIPISELWKTQVSGNPGFDFHTESTENRIIFGEAKYNARDNAYTEAAEQVIRFLNDNKHKNDILNLRSFASTESMEKLIRDDKGVALAFSMNSKNIARALSNALQNRDVIELIGRTNELYLIGVEA